MEVIVPDDQLSLAIGRKGQNVRLASRLTGFKLDVRSESEAEDEARRARVSLMEIAGVGDVVAELLYQNGFKSAEDVAQADEQSISDVEGIGSERAANVLKAARELVEQKRIQAEEEAAAAAVAAAEAAAAAAAAGESQASDDAAAALSPGTEAESPPAEEGKAS